MYLFIFFSVFVFLYLFQYKNNKDEFISWFIYLPMRYYHLHLVFRFIFLVFFKFFHFSFQLNLAGFINIATWINTMSTCSIFILLDVLKIINIYTKKYGWSGVEYVWTKTGDTKKKENLNIMKEKQIRENWNTEWKNI